MAPRVLLCCYASVLLLFGSCGVLMPPSDVLSKEQRTKIEAELWGVRAELEDRVERDENPAVATSASGFQAYQRNRNRVIELRAKEQYLEELLAQNCATDTCEAWARLAEASRELELREQLIPEPNARLSSAGYEVHTRNLERIAALKGVIAEVQHIVDNAEPVYRMGEMDFRMEFVVIPAGVFGGR